jgi:predicted membrane protein
MAFGALLTLDNLGLIEIHNLSQFWPLVLILVGISKFVQGADATGALLWAGAGAAFLASNLGLFQVKQLWPLLLVVVGARLVLGAMGRGGDAASCVGSKAPFVDASDRIDAYAILGGVSRGTNAAAFRQGAASAFMGGCEIDLRHAKITDGPAVFDAFAMWGGIEIKVPEDWAVENRGMGLLGGFVDSTRRPLQPKGTLVLTGLAIMGGVEAKN